MLRTRLEILIDCCYKSSIFGKLGLWPPRARGFRNRGYVSETMSQSNPNPISFSSDLVKSVNYAIVTWKKFLGEFPWTLAATNLQTTLVIKAAIVFSDLSKNRSLSCPGKLQQKPATASSSRPTSASVSSSSNLPRPSWRSWRPSAKIRTWPISSAPSFRSSKPNSQVPGTRTTPGKILFDRRTRFFSILMIQQNCRIQSYEIIFVFVIVAPQMVI